ncbi:MAG: NAD(P)H-dependent oxidoreductase [Bacillota bacterium]
MNSEKTFVIRPKHISEHLNEMLNSLLSDHSFTVVSDSNSIPEMNNSRIIAAVELDKAGYCIPVFEIISALYERGYDSLEGSQAVLLINSPNEMNTKSTAADIIFQLNQLGCAFPGHPVVEATGSLSNFLTWQKSMNMSLKDICLEMCRKLGERFFYQEFLQVDNPKILALHSSNQKISNTLALWNIIKHKLCNIDITELHVENGKVLDCKGCSFKTCIHFSKQSSCFYGGILVEEIYPAIEASDAIVWICPNYNDAISANLTAVINRLTALYRKTSFQTKALFGVVVSGNSGSDSVAMQLLDALCINKGFFLPPRFALMATANDPLSILGTPNLEATASAFADNIMKTLKK